MNKAKDIRESKRIVKPDRTTAVSVIKKNPKLTLRQKIEKLKYTIKRTLVEKTLKAKSHSIDEVMEYIVHHYGFGELNNDEIIQEYRELRASFIMQYAPELLGEYAAMPQLKSESKEDILEHIKQFQDRQKKAMEIPREEFDIDFHKFQITFDDINDNMYVAIEKRFDYIGGGSSGNKKITKRFQRIYKDIYRYYGVSNDDIKNKTERYEKVVRVLSL